LSHRREYQAGRINFGQANKSRQEANSYAKEIKEMPDYSNSATRECEERLG